MGWAREIMMTMKNGSGTNPKIFISITHNYKCYKIYL